MECTVDTRSMPGCLVLRASTQAQVAAGAEHARRLKRWSRRGGTPMRLRPHLRYVLPRALARVCELARLAVWAAATRVPSSELRSSRSCTTRPG